MGGTIRCHNFSSEVFSCRGTSPQFFHVILGISCFCDMAQMMMRGIPVSGSGLTFCLLPISLPWWEPRCKTERQVQINLFKNPFSWVLAGCATGWRTSTGGGSSFFLQLHLPSVPLDAAYISGKPSKGGQKLKVFWIQTLIALLVEGQELKHFPIWSVWGGSLAIEWG